jgi:ABC-2 type transport system permease protein
MSSWNIFLFEWTHFVRRPFKVIAVLLFVVASVYGLHNGASLYQDQQAEIERIQEKIDQERETMRSNYQAGISSPEHRPWVDITRPFWAAWMSESYAFKTPSPAMVYSIGQSEQYGYYKHITFQASPYDADLAEEIANPERLQTGTLDFSFALLFLLPLVLLVLLYNIKSAETEQGFMSLVEVQSRSTTAWLIARIGFYVALMAVVLIALLLYGATLTDVLATASDAFGKTLLNALIYLLLWSVAYFFIVRSSQSMIGTTLKMTGAYLLFAFIIPATVHQYLSIKQPANLMLDFIDVRDEQQAIYSLPDSAFYTRMNDLFPGITDSPVYSDSAKVIEAKRDSYSALTNEVKKASVQSIEAENQTKNNFIQRTFWFNPVSFFQNQFNRIAETHFDDYQQYRNDIQTAIDAQIQLMISDTWQDVTVDEKRFEKYAIQ